MKVLLDSGVWWYRTLELPLKKPLTDFLKNDVTEWWISPLSVAEMLYKVTHKNLPAPQKTGWQHEMVRGYRIAPFTVEAGQQAGEWKWRHGDPVDRMLAAIALTQGLTLIHIDTVLRDLKGFPNLYFPA
jgi:PIN domain nuclease of toxin-antitoxin system